MQNEEVASIFLGLQLDMDGLKSQINNAGEQTGNSFGSKFSRTFGNVFRYRIANSIINTMKSVWDYWTNGAEDAYNIQLAAETKLQEVMQTRMKATREEIQSIKDYASELQSMGIVGDEITLQGASQLATYLTSVESLKTLMGAMNNLSVSNGGAFSVSDTTSVANMLGKAISNDSISSLTRVGITFTDAEKDKWETLITEEEKAAFLADVVTENVGNMNEAYAKTSAGQLTQVNNTVGDIKEEIGQIMQELKVDFLPIVKEGLQFVEVVVDKLRTAKGYFEDFLTGLGYELPTQDIVDDISTIGAAAEETAQAAKGELADFDIFNLLGDGNSMSADIDGLTISAGDAVDGMEDIKKEIDGVGKNGNNVFTRLGQKVSEFWDNHGAPLAESLKEFGASVLDFLGTDFMQTALKTFIDWMTTALEVVLDLSKSLLDTLGGIFSGFGDFMESPTGYIKENIIDKTGDLMAALKLQSALEGQQDQAGVWNPDSILYNPELGQANLDKAWEKYNAHYGITDEQIDKIGASVANAVQKQNIVVNAQMDGITQKLTTNVVNRINKQGKYSNGSLLR